MYGVGEEPDHRFSLANERTFLAWIRTSLGLIGGGVAVEAFGVAPPRTCAASLASCWWRSGGRLRCGGLAAMGSDRASTARAGPAAGVRD